MMAAAAKAAVIASTDGLTERLAHTDAVTYTLTPARWLSAQLATDAP